MAYQTGTVTGGASAFSSLVSFLEANSWVSAWSATIAGHTGTDIVLQAPYTSANVYIGLNCVNTYNNTGLALCITGMTGVSSTATSMTGHTDTSGNYSSSTTYPNKSLGNPYCYLDPFMAMAYWFFCNTRCFKAVFRVGNTYQIIQGGLILPPVQPTSYPLPLCVGATAVYAQVTTTVDNYSNPSTDHTSITSPYFYGAGSTPVSSSYVLDPDGKTWIPCGGANVGSYSGASGSSIGASNGTKVCVYEPSIITFNSTNYLSDLADRAGSSDEYVTSVQTWGFGLNGHNSVLSNLMPYYDGSIYITDTTLVRWTILASTSTNYNGIPCYSNGYPDTLGILDGIVHVPGFGINPEDTVTDASGNEYIIFNAPNSVAKQNFIGIKVEH